MIRISVEGLPAPKGSFRISSRGRGRRPVVRKDSPKTEAWETRVGWAARMAMRGQAMYVDQALEASFVFRLERPDGHYSKARRREHELLPWAADEVPAVKPDWDKLLRSTCDALQGLVYDDDSRIVRGVCEKRYVRPGEVPGAVIEVSIYERSRAG